MLAVSFGMIARVLILVLFEGVCIRRVKKLAWIFGGMVFDANAPFARHIHGLLLFWDKQRSTRKLGRIKEGRGRSLPEARRNE